MRPVDGANMILGAILRAIRSDRGYSLAQLAALSGIPEGTLANVESGQQGLPWGRWRALANALRTPLDTLLPSTAVSWA